MEDVRPIGVDYNQYDYSMTGGTDTKVKKSWTKQIEVMQLTIDGLIDRVVKLEEEVEVLKSKQEKRRKPISLMTTNEPIGYR